MNKSPYRRKPGSKARHGGDVQRVHIRPDPGDISKDYDMPKTEALKLVKQGKLIEVGDALFLTTDKYPTGG